MIVKLVFKGSLSNKESRFKKQTVRNSGKWKDNLFIFDPKATKYDWLIIIDDLPRVEGGVQKVFCPQENTILLTTEPSSITRYGRGFASQFQYLITNQEENVLPHRNAIRSQTANSWMHGKSYDELIEAIVDKPLKKKKKLSTICSNKAMGHTMHRLRFEFTKMLQEEISDMTRCGWGYKPIDNKYEAIDDYEFHVCIENYIAPHVWTEKIADSFLGYSIPIYYGCPNIYEYFPEDSIVLIDLHDFEGSISKIKKIISTPGEYERRFEALQEARRRVIEEYNIFSLVDNIIENAPKDSSSESGIKFYNRRWMRVRYPVDLFRFFKFRIENFIKDKFKK